MVVAGYFTALFFITREATRKDLNPVDFQNLSLWIIVGLVIGARIWYVIEHWPYFSQSFLEIFKLWEGGMVFYGGFIGGFVGGVLYVKVAKMNFLEVLDTVAPGLSLGIGVGRIGCLLNGCCFGRVTGSWFGITFPRRYMPPVFWNHLKRGLISETATHSLPVIPTQLISTIDLVVIFGILWWLRKKDFFKGFLFYLFIGLYGLHRFVIDFFRYYEGSALTLKVISLSQAFSILMMILSIVLIVLGFNRRKKSLSGN